MMSEQYSPCPFCGIRISPKSTRCIYCGRELPVSFTIAGRSQDQLLNPGFETRHYLLWVLLGFAAALIVTALGALFVLRPLEENLLPSGEPGQVTLAFALAGCFFGIFLVPVFGIVGGRMGFSLGKSNTSAGVGAVLGGVLYGVLGLMFAIINVVLTN